ncbi:MAG TPA: OB-fold nucleic acid binding domain-containing protein [Acidobacteriaceae bacterium]|nr:OB-fold nucleic acid binding domain-containing protein [Acidobacteriaceae bacterium]
MKDFFAADAAQRQGQEVQSCFAVLSKQARDKKDGGTYLALVLGDRSGHIDARIWENCETLARKFEKDDIVSLRGTVDTFNGKQQLRVTEIAKARPGSFDLADLLRATSRDIPTMWAELRATVASFTDPDLKRLLFAFLDDPEIAERYQAAPAAKMMHHAWIGGLLEHVLDLCKFCDLAAGHFPLIHRDLLLTGAMLHDIGKIYELGWKTSFEYTLEGNLIGHISIGTRLLHEKVQTLPNFPDRLRILVEHIILSHHGSYEFGSPKLPMIPEAVLLHYLDDAEAKMLAMQEACAPLSTGAAAPEFVDRVRALDRSLVNTRQYLANAAASLPGEGA